MKRNSEILKGLPLYGSGTAIVALIIIVFGFIFFPKDAYPSYLNGFLFWLGLTLGCLPLLMMHHLTGGRWGFPLRPFFRAGLGTLPLMVLLVLPLDTSSPGPVCRYFKVAKYFATGQVI